MSSMFGSRSLQQDRSKTLPNPDEKTPSQSISLNCIPQEEHLDGVSKWRDQATRRRAQRGGQTCEHANGTLESKQYCPECPWCDATPRSLRSHRLADDFVHFKSENPQYERYRPLFEISPTLSSYTLNNRDPFPTSLREHGSEIPNAPSLGLATLGTRDVTRPGLPPTSCGNRILISRCGTLQKSVVNKLGTQTTNRGGRPVTHEAYAGISVDQSEVKGEVGTGSKESTGSEALSSNGNISSSSISPIPKLRLVSGLSRRELPPPDLLDVELPRLDAKETSLPESFISKADSESDGECLATRYLPNSREEQASCRRSSTSLTLEACALSLEDPEPADNLSPTFDPKWTAQLTDHAGPRGSVSSSTTISKSATDFATNSATNSSLSNQSSKRARNNNDGPPSDGEDNPPGQSRLNLRRPQNSDANLKLACPFRKHDPGKYNLSSYRICATTPWESIMRLKEHLQRVHEPIFCQKCKLQFRTEKALEAHIKGLDAAICRPTVGPIPEGISPDIANKLKSRKKTSQPDPERWKGIFGLLFPGAPVPTPYFEPVIDSISYRQDLIHALILRLHSAGMDNTIKEELTNMVMDCDAQLAADHRLNLGNSEHRPIAITEINRKSLQDQTLPSKIQPSANWNPSSPSQAHSGEKSKGEMGRRPILPNQPPTFHSASPLEPPFIVPDPPSCFCIDEHTCVSAPGRSSAVHTTYGNCNMYPTQPKTDWTEDPTDENWMDRYFDTTACAVPDPEQ